MLAMVAGVLVGLAAYGLLILSADEVAIERVPGAQITEIGEQREVTVSRLVGKVPHYSTEIRTAVSFQLPGGGKVYTDIVAGDFEVGEEVEAYEIVFNGDTFYTLWDHGMVETDRTTPLVASVLLCVLTAVAIAPVLSKLGGSSEKELQSDSPQQS